jgi:outer membrane beta-barrel protein
MGAFSINNILTQHEGGAFSVERNFGEYFGLELLLGGGYGGLTDLSSQLRLTPEAFNHTSTTDLANAGAINAYAQFGARVTPFYGKFNLAGELPVHFDFFLAAGVGFAYVTYNSILGCNEDIVTQSGVGTCPNNNFHSEAHPTFAFNAGGGMRLFINQLWTIRFEIRDMIFPDRYYTNENLLETQTNNVFQPSNLYAKPGLTQVPMIFVGLGFVL